MYVNQIYDPNHVICNGFPYKSDIAAHGWDVTVTYSYEMESDFLRSFNAFAVEFDFLRSSVVLM